MADLSITALDAATARAILPDLHRLARDQQWMDWTDENYLFDLPDKWSLSRLVTAGGTPIAYALCSRKHDRLWLHRLVVGQDQRGQGIGETLMAELGRVAREAGLAGVSLKTPGENDGAIRFYTRNGFSSCGRQGDLIVMDKADTVTVALHQPNYLPWLGYFYKIHSCDIFIVLDDAEAPNRGYINRAQIAVQGQPSWLTVPITRAGDIRINAIQQADARWAAKQIRTLDSSYAKAPHYAAYRDTIAGIIERHAGKGLADMNTELIRAVCGWLDLNAKFVSSAAFNLHETGDDRVIRLVQLAGGTRYLSGKGGANYQDPEKFAANGIELEYSSFRPVPYPQRGAAEFLPGLSVIDALANIGAQGIREMFAAAQASDKTGVQSAG